MPPLLDRTDAAFADAVRQELRALMADPRVRRDPDLAALTYYQRLVVLYFKMLGARRHPDGRPPARGLLVFHDMGAGKSILGAAICHAQLQADPHRPPIFMAPRALHANFRAEYEKYLGLVAAAREPGAADAAADAEPVAAADAEPVAAADAEPVAGGKKDPGPIRFVSLDAPNASVQLRRAALGEEAFLQALSTAAELDGRLLVIDEAQNLFRSIINGSKNALVLYQQIMDARDLRLVFLSGTPVAKNPFEAVVCFNMLAGYLGTGGVGRIPLFPEEYDEFERLFVAAAPPDDDAPRLRNLWAFQNRIYGLVSRISREDIQAQIPARLALPTLLPWEVERVVMAPEQYAAYVAARAFEDDEALQKRAHPPRTRRLTIPQGPASSYRVRTRQLSNYAPPPGLAPHLTAKRKSRFEGEPAKGEPAGGEPGAAKTGGAEPADAAEGADAEPAKGAAPAEELAPLGAEEPAALALDDLVARIPRDRLGSPKFEAILAAVERLPGPHLVYSQFRGLGGLGVFARFLESRGFAHLDAPGGPAEARRRFAVISGAVPMEDRSRLVQAARDRRVGVLMITLTGARGLNIPGIRCVHHMEPFWVLEVPNQVDGRAVRPGALQDLPPAERTVRHIMYLAVPDPAAPVQAATDVELWEGARAKQRAVEEMMRAEAAVSLECMVQPRAACRVCRGDSGTLFLPRRSLREELRRGDACAPLEVREEEAQPLSALVAAVPGEVPPGTMVQQAGAALRVFVPHADAFIEVPADDELYAQIKNLLEAGKTAIKGDE